MDIDLESESVLSEVEAQKILHNFTVDHTRLKATKKWMLKYREFDLILSRAWENALITASSDESKLVLLELIDEVLQIIKNQTNSDLKWSLGLVFSNIFAHLGNNCNNNKILRKVDNMLQRWDARRYYAKEKIEVYRSLIAYRLKVLQSPEPEFEYLRRILYKNSTQKIVPHKPPERRKILMPADIANAINIMNKPMEEMHMPEVVDEVPSNTSNNESVIIPKTTNTVINMQNKAKGKIVISEQKTQVVKVKPK